MKLLLGVCVAICFVGVYCDTAPKPEEAQYVKDCAKEHGLDEKAIADLKSSKSFNLNEASKCFAHCLLKHNGMIDDEGKLTAKFQGTDTKGCTDKTGKDKCEIAANTLDCLLQKEGATLADLNL